MACACKVNQDISYLHEKFGNQKDVSKKEITNFRITEFLKKIIIYLVTLLMLPFMFFNVIFILFKKDKTIKIINKKWPIPIRV